ncbi:MAG TPA: NAD(P)/FAD-dependent oxidoreductase [Candidatus Nitrosotenuis sp.]|nr:NAD(P)/FAD-dependent oxidoreductase [Candidatus Nitrosotenuis sp.]
MKYDAIVVGGGHNGLVHAAYLARAGLKVVVLERRHRVGGATITEEIYPGFRYLTGSYLVSLLRPQVLHELELWRHGLELMPLESTFVPLPGGDYLADWPDHDQTRLEIARHSRRDAEAYEEYTLLMRRLCVAVRPLLDMLPPDPWTLSPRDLEQLARLRGILEGMGRDDFRVFCRLMTMSAADFLEEWFETPALVAVKSTSGIIGTFLGVRSPGTGYVLLHHYLGMLDGVPRAWAFPRGGTGALSQAIAAAAREAGAEIRENAPVARILVKDSTAVGVALESGEEIYARRVISNADARRTFLDLVEPGHLPEEFLQEVRRFRTESPACKVNLALDGLPRFPCLPPGREALLRGSIEIAPSVDYLERAYDDAKYGGWSRRPFMDALIPSLLDPGMAPPGRHVMSIFVQYASSNLEGGWTEERRRQFLEVVIDTLAEHAPDIKDKILHKHIMTPADIEETFGMTGGHIFHGELALHQILCLRPSPRWAQYRTPLRHLWMCGSSTHPGGCITGAPGRNAALELLRDWSQG